MALLELDNVGLSFSGVRALDGVNFAIEAGALHAVIGPNGAGKSSLFNCISGIHRHMEGRVWLDGKDLTGVGPTRIAHLGVARMFQNLALFEHLTVLENLLLGRHTRYRTGLLANLFWTRRAREEEIRHREKAEEVIDFLDLEHFRWMPVAVLPYGIRKRVELGRALCMEPRLLLLDEPTAGLNQEETEDMANHLLDIRHELGVTQVLIGHELRFVMDLATQVTVLDRGRVIANGPPASLREDARVLSAYVGGTVAA
ncbi:ABC transporter ATP-binding protein [Myxococcus sp. K15C18031901]|uniref:ABC transporter ATP-binding protein n=1 Tax=Myxococcus dinghuensis TaxID=2906761 RepID=UPI0020A7A32F|nr:ABC transporter ATP-binding protein [Myxococcus dinghuensis]MCP3098392.1 ABC transporter ATP-binding protein [Myxococcus dinghuensis]